MTRPGGSTPNGLPYPGSNLTHAQTPGALQALAEAIDGRLSSITPGVILDTFHGYLGTTGSGYLPRGFTVPFPRLAAVQGWVGCYGVDLGGENRACYVVGSAGSNYGSLCAVPFVSAAVPGAFTLHAIGWGPPR